MERVVITGSQGFLGRYLVSAFLHHPRTEVVGIGRSRERPDHFTHDLSWRGKPVAALLPQELMAAAHDARYSYVSADLRDVDRVRELLVDVTPSIIVHSASALRDEAWETLVEANLIAVAGLLEAARRMRPRPRTVLVSSGSVYGVPPEGSLPIREDGPIRGHTPYGVSKIIGEEIARSDPSWPSATVARVFNLIGPGLQDRHLPAVLARQFAAIAQGLGPALVEAGALTATRDFIDARDAAAAIVALAARGSPGDAYNVASGVEVSMEQLFEAFESATGTHAELVDRGDGREDISRVVADVSRLEALGVLRAWSLERSVAEMAAYYDAYRS